MKTIDFSHWEEFESRVEQLVREHSERKRSTDSHISDYLFRGQSNSSWSLTTTLERYTSRLLGLEEYYRVVRATKPQVETFTEGAWPIPSVSEYMKRVEAPGFFFAEGNFPAYEYFVYLRHQSFPSPLLDWTASPYVAAYFAFRDICSTAPNISIYAYREYTTGHKSGSSNDAEITGLGPYVRSHRRHFHQQSQYTICTIKREDKYYYAPHEDVFTNNSEDQDELWKFNIPSSERHKVLARLEQYNINALSLFDSEESLLETLALREIFLRNVSNPSSSGRAEARRST